MQISQHLIAQIDEVGVVRFETLHESPLQVFGAILYETKNTLLVHVMQSNAMIPGAHSGSPVFSHVGLDILVNRLVEVVEQLVGCLVLGKRMRLPVIQLDLLTHVEKKIYVVGAHRGLLLLCQKVARNAEISLGDS